MPNPESKVAFALSYVRHRTGKLISPTDDLFEVAGLDSLDFMELLEDFSNQFALNEILFEIEDWNLIRTIDGIVSASE